MRVSHANLACVGLVISKRTHHKWLTLIALVCYVNCCVISTIECHKSDISSLNKVKRFAQDDSSVSLSSSSPSSVSLLPIGDETTILPDAASETTTTQPASATTTDVSVPPTVIPIIETIIDTPTTSTLAQDTTTATSTGTGTGTGTNTSTTSTISTVDSPDLTTAAASNESKADGTTTSSMSSASKIPRINYTDIETAFNAALSEDEVRQRWTKMNNTIKKGVQEVVKMVFPHIASLATDAHVSGDCSGGMLKWMLNLRNLRSWAIKMLDAVGKPGAGIFSGQLTMFGNYRQCLDIRAPDEDEIEIYEVYREFFRGKYCVMHIKPNLPQRPAFYNLNATIESLKRQNYKYYEKTLEMRAKVVRCETSVDDNDVSNSTTTKTTIGGLDSNQVTWLLVVIGLIGFVLIASALATVCALLRRSHDSYVTAHDNYGHNNNYPIASTTAGGKQQWQNKKNKKNNSGSKQHWSQSHEALMSSNGKLRSLLQSMSIASSMQHLSLEGAYEYTCDYYGGTCSWTDGDLDSLGDALKPMPLYGVRAALVLWCCLVTSTVQLNYQYLRELLPLRSLIMQWPMQLIINSTMQFESLISLCAFTFAYVSTSEASSVKQLCRYALDKFVRLAPSIMVLVALTIVTPALQPVVIHGGPLWADHVQEPARVCAANGIVNLMFLQNYLPFDKICLPQTWLFCVELQLMILAIPLVHWLNRSYERTGGTVSLRSMPTIICVSLIVLGSLWSAINVYMNELPPAWFYTFPDADDRAHYNGQHLFLAHTHLSTFFVGLLAGHWTRVSITTRAYNMAVPHHTSQHESNKCSRIKQTLAHWTLATAALILMLSLTFVTHSWSVEHLPDAAMSAAYDALARLLWSICMATLLWQLVVATPRASAAGTATRRPNIVVRSLAHPLMVLAGRLSILVYLIYPYVHTLIAATQEQSSFSSMFVIFHTFVGNLVLTGALAYVISILIEQPYRRLVSKHVCIARHCTRRLNISASPVAAAYPMSEPRRPRGSITAGISNIANLNTLSSLSAATGPQSSTSSFTSASGTPAAPATTATSMPNVNATTKY
ncbi:hypothetical protein GZH46_01670, partial [Fragariocoptes setiger]